MTYLGGKALLVSTFLMVCLSVPVYDAYSADQQTGSNLEIISSTIDEDPNASGASVILRWTAPGDDGDIGRAAGYDMRVVPASRGPIDCDEEWNDAYQLRNEPAPSPAGSTDSLVIKGLISGSRYYFAVRSYDEANNLSGISNSPLIEIPATPNITIVGDVNNSGRIDGLDVVFLVNSLKGKSSIPEPQYRADVNGIPGIDGLDIAYLRAYLSGGPSPMQNGGDSNSANPEGPAARAGLGEL